MFEQYFGKNMFHQIYDGSVAFDATVTHGTE